MGCCLFVVGEGLEYPRNCSLNFYKFLFFYKSEFFELLYYLARFKRRKFRHKRQGKIVFPVRQ